ncbi:unnamed protein product [Prorocentrum cordatum]|uniref:Uncharacterized protein n=1 Tax=Prorocentrum cordatum TaxID=2364126 RepID=A0ABN9WSC7_9DINO|nr:unnamed protein product [Polarella glacialis]CAK0888135.1 unnamed protein product [Polarella glacialis]
MPAQRRLISKALALTLAVGACRLASPGGAGSAFAPSTATLAAPKRVVVADCTHAERDADARVLENALRGAMAFSASEAALDHAGSERDADAWVLEDALRGALASSASRAVVDHSYSERDADAWALEDALSGAIASASRGGAGSAFGPSVTAVAAPARAIGDRTDAERDADARMLADALRGAEAAASSASSDPGPRLWSGGALAELFPETLLNPTWATCYVEARLPTRPVMEEWVMRGEREVIALFKSWRRSSQEATSIRCVDTPVEDALQSECLACAAHDGVHAQMAPFAVSGQVSSEGVMTFLTGSSQCMASAARGQGFCKSGQLLLG